MQQKVYRALPRPLQTTVVSLLGLRNRIRRYGRAFRDQLALLSKSENWDDQEIFEWQVGKVREILRHAHLSVPYYRDRQPQVAWDKGHPLEVLHSLPFLSKSAIREDPKSFQSGRFGHSQAVSVLTSGTTGTSMRFTIDQASRQRHFAFFHRLIRWARLDTSAWRAVFMGRVLGSDRQMEAQPWRTDFANRSVYYSSYHITRALIPRYLGHLSSYDCEWIEGYPSAIGNLTELGLSEGLELPKPKAVILSSETLDSATRETIEAGFGARIWEFYAAAEQAAFISQCQAGSLHINPEYGLVELIPRGTDYDGIDLYEIVATSFMNFAMPLIRYLTDDLVTKGPDRCPCGRRFPTVGRIVGRVSTSIILPDGRRVAGISTVPKGLPVEQSQLVQISEGTLEFRVVPRWDDWSEDVEKELERRLRDRLGDSLKVEVRTVVDIPPGRNGKVQLVRKELEP